MAEIVEYQLPPDATETTWQALSELVCADITESFGAYGSRHTPAELLTQAQGSPARIRRWLAVSEGRVLGFARSVTGHPDNPDGADVYAWVRPEHRSRGVGRRLAEAACGAGESGRITARLFTSAVGSGGLAGPDGGFVDADHPGVRLALSLGLELGVVYELGRYDLEKPMVPLEQVLRSAREPQDEGWTTHCFEGVPPKEFQSAVAEAKNQTLQDAPQGTVAYTGKGWDAERVATHYQRLVTGHRVFFTLVMAGEEVVALTELSSPRRRPAGMGQQLFTVVMPSYRGHRLGLWIKATNLAFLKREVPECPGVVTMNAAANRHMRAVNETLGFTTTRAVGIFRSR
ncbi:MAG: GNAT family N-acetyltransferase [Propionibacteriaceae bacterium]|nr:GNAT family N-acetyltransferase [Propionibacteriaceae bacterium]